MFAKILENTASCHPLVHCITNYISANDCANILLACGASPIMADALQEVEEITSHSNALVLNMGTLNEDKLRSMLCAGQQANRLGIPIILDPVGVGASTFRRNAAKQLLETLHLTVIRGNASEIETLTTYQSVSQGIDVNTTSLESTSLLFAQELSKKIGAIVVISGATDLITYKRTTYQVFNGHPILTRITGTGCMLTSLIGAYCGANPSSLLEATVAAVGTMGLCAELAYDQTESSQRGTGTLRIRLLDAISLLTPTQLQGGLCYDKHQTSP
ncbi:MAG: hydroxyethylthiazole kinase [Cellulosilyticaceae bacterium]